MSAAGDGRDRTRREELILIKPDEVPHRAGLCEAGKPGSCWGHDLFAGSRGHSPRLRHASASWIRFRACSKSNPACARILHKALSGSFSIASNKCSGRIVLLDIAAAS